MSTTTRKTSSVSSRPAPSRSSSPSRSTSSPSRNSSTAASRATGTSNGNSLNRTTSTEGTRRVDSQTTPGATSRTAGVGREQDSSQISEEARTAQGAESARSPVNFSTWGLDGKNGNGTVGQVDAPGAGKSEPKPGSEEARLVERAASQGLQLDKGELLSRARGSEGSKVKQLQEMLNKNGARLEPDGIMGRDTSRAVRDFQRKQKLKMIDGVVGPETQEALNRMQQPAPPANQGQKPPETTAVDPARQTTGTSPLTLGRKPPANMSVRPPETNMSVRPPETNMSVRPPEGSTSQQTDSRTGLPPTTPTGGEKVNLGRLSTLQSAQRNPDGSYSFKAGASIDVDGSGPKYGDPYAQSQTSLNLKGEPKYPNADKVPYYVLPPQVARQMGAKVGDLGMISYQGKSIAAVFADVGPRHRIGELSRNAALQLGIPASPTSGGVPSGVEYRVFPGSRGDKRPSAADLTPEKLTQRVQQLTGTQQADQERKAGETGASTVGGANQVQPVGQTQAQGTEAIGPANKLPVPHGLRGIMKTFGPAGSKNLRSVRAAAGPGGREIPVSMHTKVADQFKQAFDEIKRQGLSSEIQSFDGSYSHRPKKGKSKGLSTHSWGISFDLNADRYPFGTSPAQTSQKFRQIAEILKSHGFQQLPNDAHHFQYATGY